MKRFRDVLIIAGFMACCLAIPRSAEAQTWRYRFRGPHEETITLFITKRANGYEVSGRYFTRQDLRLPIHGSYSATTGRLRARADYGADDEGIERSVAIDGERVEKGRLRITSPWVAEATVEVIPSAADNRRSTFIRIDSLTKVTNTHQGELTIDAAGESARLQHRNGGLTWESEYTWEVPPTLVAGEDASVRIGVFVTTVRPRQSLSDSINVLAPDFAEQVIANYPDHSSSSRTFKVPISAGYADRNELKITVGFMSSTVVYTYRRR